MKVKIGNYTSWFGPYQLADALCFWVKKQPNEFGFLAKPGWVHKFGEFLAYGSIKPYPEVGETYDLLDSRRKETWLYKFLLFIDEIKPQRKIKVKIDPWDTWSMDNTLAYIILPMLRDLQKNKQGSPFVDDEDVPEELRSTSAPALTEEQDLDDNHFKRWDYVLSEMIFAFQNKVDDDWEEKFTTGEISFSMVKQENGNYLLKKDHNHTYEVDTEGRKAYQERISNGFRLFGKYYEALWT